MKKAVAVFGLLRLLRLLLATYLRPRR